MLVFDAPVAPDALTWFMRNIPIQSELSLLQAAGRMTSRNNKVNWGQINRRNRTARFRSFDGRIHVAARDGASEQEVSLLPLSDSLNMGEYERLQLEFARLGGTRQDVLVDALYDDADALTRYYQNRVELALGDVLTDGVLTINENGFQGEADFGVPGDQIVTAGTLWTNSAAPILTNLIAWTDVMRAKGVVPGAIRTSQRVIRLVTQNDEIIAAAYGTAAGRTFATIQDVNSVLASHGIPPFVAPYDTSVDVDGTETRVIPDNRVLITPANLGDLVSVVTGVSATALELVNAAKVDFSFSDAVGMVGVVIKEGPPFREFTFVDGVVMPVLNDAQRLLVATVA